jgi:hypothetical protein
VLAEGKLLERQVQCRKARATHKTFRRARRFAIAKETAVVQIDLVRRRVANAWYKRRVKNTNNDGSEQLRACDKHSGYGTAADCHEQGLVSH